MKINFAKAGVWIRPHMDAFKMGCCDCGLVHLLRFRVAKDGQVEMQAFRAERATKRHRQHERWKDVAKAIRKAERDRRRLSKKSGVPRSVARRKKQPAKRNAGSAVRNPQPRPGRPRKRVR